MSYKDNMDDDPGPLNDDFDPIQSARDWLGITDYAPPPVSEYPVADGPELAPISFTGFPTTADDRLMARQASLTLLGGLLIVLALVVLVKDLVSPYGR